MAPPESRESDQVAREPGTDSDPAWSAGASPARPAEAISLAGYSDFVAIARGGDSVVYRARQDGLKRYVAVKVLLLDDPAAVARFQRELDITVRLGQQHPNIVTVLDTATTGGGQPCLVMEYYELGSLHDRLRAQGPLRVGEVLAAGAVVADALAFAHGQGLLHRDVKPQNILLLPTSYVLADFGIARRADAGHSASLERFSYRHASPQVLDGEPPTVADDIYSLGSTLHTLLDGRPPFASDDPDSDTALTYLRRARSDTPRPLSRADVPAALSDILARCLAKQRDDRFADAAQLRAALSEAASQRPAWAPADAAPAGAPDTAWEPEAQRPAWRAPATRPTAASALAHLDGDDAFAPPDDDVDAREATGFGPIAEPPAPATVPQAAEAGRRVPWRRVLVFAAVALAAGSLLGIIGTALRDDPDESGEAPSPGAGGGATTGQVVPTFTGQLPSPTGPVQVDVGDPQLAPEITGARDRSTSIVLEWTDPSDGKAIFVVAQRVGDGSQALLTVPPGTRQVAVEGLDPARRQYCFQVVAIVDAEHRGVSPERCVTRG